MFNQVILNPRFSSNLLNSASRFKFIIILAERGPWIVYGDIPAVQYQRAI